MKPLVVSILNIALLFGTCAWAQQSGICVDCPENMIIVTETYTGVIFGEGHGQLLPVDPYSRAFTPKVDDIVQAETLLAAQIDELDSSRSQAGYLVQPVIRRNLARYHRQYFGMIGMNGHRIIWVNFLWSDDLDAFPGWQCNYTPVIEGDTWFWSIYVDLDDLSCYKLETGGS